MELGIEGKRALITGAGRGIGKAIAIGLADEGVKVAAVSRTKKELKDLLKDLKGKGHCIFECDLLKENSSKQLLKKIKKDFGEPDIIVNNLGGTLNIKNPYCSIQDWRKIIRLNLEVAIELNNLFIPYMKSKKWGRIVNISSISSKENQGPVTYCTVKAALNAYTRSMGRILASDGIIMSAVLPGAVFTEKGYWEDMLKNNPEQFQKYLKERMAIQRFGKPEEIASVVLFLCSKNASFCVGSNFPADGGQGRCFF